MKNYDAIVGNYGIVMEYNSRGNVFTGHIDYIGKNIKNKRSGISFIVNNEYKNIRYSHPELVTKQVNKYLFNVLLDIRL
jgi:hypothetical protein